MLTQLVACISYSTAALAFLSQSRLIYALHAWQQQLLYYSVATAMLQQPYGSLADAAVIL